MAGNVINSTFINAGREVLSLAASASLGPFGIGGSRVVGVRCTFSSTGTFDAAGTLAVKVGPTGKQTTVAFQDDSGDTVEGKTVAAADDATTFLFDGIETADGNITVAWTRTSGGADDSVLVEVVTKGN